LYIYFIDAVHINSINPGELKFCFLNFLFYSSSSINLPPIYLPFSAVDCRLATGYWLLAFTDWRLATAPGCYQGAVEKKKICHNAFPPIFIFGKH